MVEISLREWSAATPKEFPELAHLSLADLRLPDRLAGALSILDLREGPRIEATSFVGRLNLGAVDLRIVPKLSGMELGVLARYTYGLRDLRLFNQVATAAAPDGFEEMLARQLVGEVDHLLSQGLNRRYDEERRWLAAPRGRLAVRTLAVAPPRTRLELPCVYAPRVADHAVNQALRAGLRLALRLLLATDLRQEIERLDMVLAQEVSAVPLTAAFRRQFHREANRLTSHYEPALRLVELLADGCGVAVEGELERVEVPGFLFDMNRFFQAFLSRFLRDHLEGCRVEDERSLRGMMHYRLNPRNRQAPQPRPDFVVFPGQGLPRLLDAKYRDLWETELPREWLYQLAIYAMSGTEGSESVILYATTNQMAKVAEVEVRDPLSHRQLATVKLRPVHLPQIAALLAERSPGARARLCELAAELTFGELGVAEQPFKDH